MESNFWVLVQAFWLVILWVLLAVDSRISRSERRQAEEDLKILNRLGTAFELMGQIDKIVVSEHEVVKTLLERCRVLGSMDIGIHQDAGFLVLCANVKGQDMVQLWQIPKNLTLEDYRRIKSYLQDTIGVEFRFLDAPRGMKEFFFEKD